MLFHPICSLNVEVILTMASLACNDWQHAEQQTDR